MSRIFRCIPEAVYFYCCVLDVSVVKFTGLILEFYKFDEYGRPYDQMDCGNPNLTKYLH